MAPPKRSRKTDGLNQPVTTVNNLDVFNLNPVQLSIINEKWEWFLPMTQVQNTQQSITIAVPASGSQWTDSQLMLEVDYKVFNGDGTALAADVEVAVAENMGHVWMSDIDMTINGVTISGRSGGNYPYIAYLHSVFESDTAKKTQYDGLEFLYQSTNGTFDNFTDVNLGFKVRKDITALSSNVYTMNVMKSPICLQDKPLPPNVRFDLVIRQKNDAFRINSGMPVAERTQILKIQNVKLWVKRLELLPALHFAMLKRMQTTPLSYPVKRFAVQSYTALPGTQTLELTLLATQTVLPSAVYLMVLSSDRYTGNYALNPFMFDLSNVKNVKLTSELRTYAGDNGLNPDATARKVYAEYFEMLKATNFLNATNTNGISWDDFLHGYGLISFSLRRAYLDQQNVNSAPTSGSLRCHIETKAALALNTVFLFVFRYDNNIYINSNFAVSMDYTVNG